MEKTKFVQDLQKNIYQYRKQSFSDIVILCIGTNKLIGDSIGPVVGQKLKKENIQEKVYIYGDMKETINFKNAKQVIENIFKIYEKPFIITIDSALGTQTMVSKIVVSKGIIRIGKSLGRSICYPSHITIKGVVGEYRNTIQENLYTLKTVKQEIVDELSNKMAKGINQVICQWERSCLTQENKNCVKQLCFH